MMLNSLLKSCSFMHNISQRCSEFGPLILTLATGSLRGNVFFKLLYPVVCQLNPHLSFVLFFFFLYGRESLANSLHAIVKIRTWDFESNSHRQIPRHHSHVCAQILWRQAASPHVLFPELWGWWFGVVVKMRGAWASRSWCWTLYWSPVLFCTISVKGTVNLASHSSSGT